jgi:hypothetical protein
VLEVIVAEAASAQGALGEEHARIIVRTAEQMPAFGTDTGW